MVHSHNLVAVMFFIYREPEYLLEKCSSRRGNKSKSELSLDGAVLYPDEIVGRGVKLNLSAVSHFLTESAFSIDRLWRQQNWLRTGKCTTVAMAT